MVRTTQSAPHNVVCGDPTQRLMAEFSSLPTLSRTGYRTSLVLRLGNVMTYLLHTTYQVHNSWNVSIEPIIPKVLVANHC